MARYCDSRMSMFVMLLFILNTALCVAEEPRHCSRFHYEEQLLEKMIRMEVKMEDIERQVRDLKAAGATGKSKARPPSVAFRSILSRDIGQVQTGQTIIFDQVDLNHGSAYNFRNGFFTAPYNGTYLFSLKLGNPARKPSAFFLIQNDAKIEYVIAGHTSGWNLGGVTTVTELLEKDQVWVQGEGHVSGAHGTGRYHTSFSGVLLQTHEEQRK